jgi:hypothetical protein
MCAKFWEDLRCWGQIMMKEGVFGRKEFRFGDVTDSPPAAVDLMVRSLPFAVKARLRPACS